MQNIGQSVQEAGSAVLEHRLSWRPYNQLSLTKHDPLAISPDPLDGYFDHLIYISHFNSPLELLKKFYLVGEKPGILESQLLLSNTFQESINHN